MTTSQKIKYKFKPTTALYKIKRLLSVLSKVYIIQGGQGAGKTISILMLLIDFAQRNSNKKISIVSDELSKMKRTVIRDFLNIMRDWNVFDEKCWNKTDKIYTLPNGTFIEFLGLDVHDVGKGMRRDIVYFNEANKLQLESYRQVASRCKLNILDFNPDKRFWGHDLITNNNFLKLTFRDNEYLSKEEVNSILEYKERGYNEDGSIKNEYWANVWRVYGLGEEGSVEGRVFTHFKKISYIDFVNLKFRSVYAVDWGKNHGFGIVQLKYDYYTNTLYCHELNYDSENKILNNLPQEAAQAIRNHEGGVILYTFKRLNIPKDAYIVCDSARPENIQLLQSNGWEYAYGIEKPKGSVMAGITLLQSTNVYYTDCSSNIDNEQASYSYNKDRLGVIDDEVIKENDDLMDPIRYGRRHFENNK